MTAQELCYTDVLKHGEDGAYIITAIHQQPIVVEGQQHPHFQLVGFTLLETKSLTRKEVTKEEMQQQLDQQTITPYQPPVTRRIFTSLK